MKAGKSSILQCILQYWIDIKKYISSLYVWAANMQPI